MKKISNKGFVLAETIIVTVFMVTIFSALYSNYYPIMANYEKREFYDDIDSKYIAFWMKYMIQDRYYNLNTTAIDNNGYVSFSCNNIGDAVKRNTCKKLVESAGFLSNPYCKGSGPGGKCESDEDLKYVTFITKYSINTFREHLVSADPVYTNISDGFIDYLNLLPAYTKNNQNGANYRLIIELYDNKVTTRDPIYKYATIEVKR